MTALDGQAEPDGITDAVQTSEQAPAVALMPWGTNEWAVVVQAGSDSADLYRALARMPAGLEFSESHGDVNVILVYRVPQVPSPGPKLGAAVLSTLGAADLGLADLDVSRWMTAGEKQAYRAGQADAFDAVRRAVTDTMGHRGMRTG